MPIPALSTLFLAVLNPDTGDRNASLMKFVVAALIIAVIVIVVYIVTAAKAKSGKPKHK